MIALDAPTITLTGSVFANGGGGGGGNGDTVVRQGSDGDEPDAAATPASGGRGGNGGGGDGGAGYALVMQATDGADGSALGGITDDRSAHGAGRSAAHPGSGGRRRGLGPGQIAGRLRRRVRALGVQRLLGRGGGRA